YAEVSRWLTLNWGFATLLLGKKHKRYIWLVEETWPPLLLEECNLSLRWVTDSRV
ncbi:hypothetical protein C2E23DRAFT_739440, partial [Lenzites betulinus]